MGQGGALVTDSVTHLTDMAKGRVAACASHGGTYAALYAAQKGVAALILNDAGIGRDRAGVAGLAALAQLGVPAATVSHLSCRIGDGADMAARGVLSVVNSQGAALGLAVGMTCARALAILTASGLPPSPPPPPLSEARHVLFGTLDNPEVVALDSAGLIGPVDAGRIVLTGSHGGVLGGNPATAAKVDVDAAAFNDAGIGRDAAGLSRLPALQARGIAGFTVSAQSARIGEGLSTWHDGIVSASNALAEARGVSVGQTCQQAVAALRATRRSGA
jgi:hypothetical protein